MATLIIMLVTVWVAVFGPPTFKDRWSPAIERPLHSISMARAGFCYPGKCIVG